MAILTGVPRIRVDDLVAGGDVGALGDVATVQNSVWYETRMFWITPTLTQSRDTGGFVDLYRATTHRPLGYDFARLFVHVTGTGGGTHQIRITINGDDNTYSVPHATPSEFFVPLISASDLQRVLVEVDIDGTGTNVYDITLCLVLDGEEDEVPPVLTFGSGSANFDSYADLPSVAPNGQWAVDVRTPGATYRAHNQFGRAWWIPSVAYANGTGFTLLCACDGTEDASGLTARGVSTSTAGQGSIVYQPGGVDVIRLRCAGLTDATNVSSASSATLGTGNLHPTYGPTTDTWVVCQIGDTSGAGAGGFLQPARIISTAWQIRFGRRASQQDQDRFSGSGNADLTANTNWLNPTSNLTAAAASDTHELIRRNQPTDPGAGSTRVEARRSGDGYISILPTTGGVAGNWFADAATGAASTNRAIMDVRTFLVVVRP